MKDVFEDIHEIITNPQDEDDEKIGAITCISFILGALGWLVAYHTIYQFPIWMGFACWGLSLCFCIVWYNIKDDYETRSKITHYVYALISVVLNGSWLVAFPIMVVFAIITMPLWICSLIKR